MELIVRSYVLSRRCRVRSQGYIFCGERKNSNKRGRRCVAGRQKSRMEVRIDTRGGSDANVGGRWSGQAESSPMMKEHRQAAGFLRWPKLFAWGALTPVTPSIIFAVAQ